MEDIAEAERIWFDLCEWNNGIDSNILHVLRAPTDSHEFIYMDGKRREQKIRRANI